MNIFMTGGSGFVGSALAAAFVKDGDHVTVLTRDAGARKGIEGVRYVPGNPVERGPWQDEVAGHEVIINLAGASIFGRWSRDVKETIRQSRILTTTNLVEAVLRHGGGAETLLSTSAVGYYGSRGDEALTESASAGEGFLASLCVEWEDAAMKAAGSGIRVIICRLGIVLGSSGGALGQMVPLFRRGLGSPLGSGRQWFSWIHERDLVEVYRFLLAGKELSGPFNCTAPSPVTNREFTKALASAMGVPAFMPAVPGFVLKIMMGEAADAVLGGQKVLPKRLLEAGFRFQYPEVGEALQAIFNRGE